MNLLNTKKGIFFVTVSFFLLLIPPLDAGQENVQKLELWSECFEQKEICVQIYLEGLIGKQAGADPKSIPPTILQDEDASITVEATSTAATTDGEDLQGDLQPIEINALESMPLIEEETVSEKKLKELIGDTEVIQRLLDGRPVDKLAITIIRQDLEVTVKKISGQTLLRRKITLNIAKAEEAKKKNPSYPGCTIPDDAQLILDEPNVAYTLPEDKQVHRDKKGKSGYSYRYRVGPQISYFDKEGKKMEYRECYNRFSELDGVATRWYENGKKEKESEYKDGQRHGTETTWYESGKKKYEKHFKNEKKDGSFTKWFEDGHRHCVDQYKNGKLDGVSIYWGESKPGGDKRSGFRGIINREYYYNNGELVKKIFYYYEGWKHVVEHYRNGKRHGLTITYRKDGKAAITQNYVNGKEMK